MSPSGTDVELAREIGSLIAALEDLQGELEPGDRERRRLPTPRDILWFTSEVTIPATILVLETNVRVLKLLQRTIRMTASDSARSSGSSDASEAVRGRAEALGRQTLDQLEGTLDDVQSAVAGRPSDDEAAALLAEARRLRQEIQSDLAASQATEGAMDREPGPGSIGGPAGQGDAARSDADPTLPGADRSTGVNIDVESELESIKDQIDDEDGSDSDADGDS